MYDSSRNTGATDAKAKHLQAILASKSRIEGGKTQ
jgi:hypothetical protein